MMNLGMHIVPWIDRDGGPIWRLVIIGRFWTRVIAQSRDAQKVMDAAMSIMNYEQQKMRALGAMP